MSLMRALIKTRLNTLVTPLPSLYGRSSPRATAASKDGKTPLTSPSLYLPYTAGHPDGLRPRTGMVLTSPLPFLIRQVIPTGYGRVQPLYFPLDPKYWFPSLARRGKASDTSTTVADDEVRSPRPSKTF